MEWRRRRWRRLLNLIDHLPRNSAYVDALSSDEEWARQVLDRYPEPPPAKQRMADWSPEMERLTDLYDLVHEVIRVMVALKGGKPGKTKPLPRPVTALERQRRRMRDTERASRHRSLTARLLPHKAEPDDQHSA